MFKRILTGALLLSAIALPLFSAAQQDARCGTQEQLNRLYTAHPELAADYQAFLSENARVTEENGITRIVYTIPIVFHILHEYGNENITDAQVYDAVEILNEDFRRQNPDISDVIAEFTGITADCQIEFRLAALDPDGNCTNGIEHIYSHETTVGDDWSKLNQWHRSDYLNIWVTKNTGEGISGYTYHPTDVHGQLFYADGIIVLNSYLGSIETSSVNTSRTLTHEVGHWLGLSHVWGGGAVGQSCGDDGIADTPVTKGHWMCDLDDDACTPGIIENVQNYMEYAFCSRMFTNDQATFMRNVIQQPTAQRNNLITAENHTETGIATLPAPTCVPVADFSVNRNMICPGDNVTYSDVSWNAGVSSRLWSFPGGTPSSSTLANPVVSYSTPGYHTATLKVSNAAGTDSLVTNNIVYVSGSWNDFHGPTVEDFESTSANWWMVQNPEANFGAFTLMNGVGKNLSTCYALKSYRDISQIPQFEEGWFYNNRLGMSKDYLISPAFDLSNTTNVSISFDYAYGSRAATEEDLTEVLRVYSSKDCGKTWQLRKTVADSNLITVGYINSDFEPTSDSQWKTASFTYAANGMDTRTRFRFEFIASDYSNNLFIDNINISGTLGIDDGNNTLSGLQISPNPVASGSSLVISVESQEQPTDLELRAMNGALISTYHIPAGNGLQTIELPMHVAKGCYLLNAAQGASKVTHRVIVD